MNFFDLFRSRKSTLPNEVRQLPDFLVIGVQKGGTSWLWNQLRQHPNIWMPPFKELQFFNHEFIPAHRKWTTIHCERALEMLLEKKKRKPHFKRGQNWQAYLTKISEGEKPSLEWYRNCFSFPVKSGVVRGDVSPAYCSIPDEGVDYVKELLPEGKIIMIIRNPHKRVISQLRMKISRSKIDTSNFNEHKWLKFIDDENFYQKAHYSSQIPRWNERYNDKMLYLPFDEIRSNPQNFLKKITHHLGIATFSPKEPNTAVHVTTKHPIPPFIDQIMRERMASEEEFLHKYFSEEFMRYCKF